MMDDDEKKERREEYHFREYMKFQVVKKRMRIIICILLLEKGEKNIQKKTGAGITHTESRRSDRCCFRSSKL